MDISTAMQNKGKTASAEITSRSEPSRCIALDVPNPKAPQKSSATAKPRSESDSRLRLSRQNTHAVARITAVTPNVGEIPV